jgi:hypothetical protein
LLEKRPSRGAPGRGNALYVADRHVSALNISNNTNAVNVYAHQLPYYTNEGGEGP